MTDRPCAEYAAARIVACECLDCAHRAVQAEDIACPDCGQLTLPILCGVCCLPLSTLDPEVVCQLPAGMVHTLCCPDGRHQ